MYIGQFLKERKVFWFVPLCIVYDTLQFINQFKDGVCPIQVQLGLVQADSKQLFSFSIILLGS